MKKIGSFDAKTHLSQILREVKAGEVYQVTKRGEPVAVISGAGGSFDGSDADAAIKLFAGVREKAALKRTDISEMIKEGRK